MTYRTILTEWARCLLSPAYAETTWLRISPHDEQVALSYLKRAVASIAVAALIMVAIVGLRTYRLYTAPDYPQADQINVKVIYEDQYGREFVR